MMQFYNLFFSSQNLFFNFITDFLVDNKNNLPISCKILIIRKIQEKY